MTTEHAPRRNVFALMFGAIGVVFGDIGTSPLYAMKETFAGHHPLPLDRLHVLGVLSLMFWSIMLVVSAKYVAFIMRADNRGEGGSLALLALASRATHGRTGLGLLVVTLGIFAAALFYGDAVITPAISILSAVEGLQVVAPAMQHYIIPATLAIVVVLFLIQRHGTDAVGKVFGPVMLLWFTILAVTGIRNIGLTPEVLKALSPHWAILFIANDGWTGFLALGSVVLAVTGAEALYADMGHFGKIPIRLAWYLVALPALLLQYFGQGALLLARPEAIENPLFNMAPGWAGLPLLLLATCATVIASQAVISGAFSVTRQAIQLGYLPRMTIIHTSAQEIGQVYLPVMNWMLLVVVIGLVIGFKTSSNLAAAYGIAVTGTMIITTALAGIVMVLNWGWRIRRVLVLMGVFMVLEMAFFLANSTKIPDGGWFPLAIGIVIFVLLTTWKQGRALLMAKLSTEAMPVEDFVAALSDRVVRVPGTAIFLTGTREGVPLALLHNMKHNKVLHERVILMTVSVEEVPVVAEDRRLESMVISPGIQRLILRFGFMEDLNIPKTLAHARTDQLGFFYEPMSISYFLSRETIIPSVTPGMAPWREEIFAWMSRSATNAMDFFHLPSNRVVELGAQVEI